MVGDKDIDELLCGASVQDDDLTMLRKHVSELGVRFDSVHIFATRHEMDSGGTITCNHGAGNWFSRYGNVQLWVKSQQSGNESNGD